MRPITATAATLLALAAGLAALFFLSHGYTMFAVLAIAFGTVGLVMYVTYSAVPLSEAEPYITMVLSMYMTASEKLTPPVTYTYQDNAVLIVDSEGNRRTSPFHLFVKYLEDRYGIALRGAEFGDVQIRNLVSSVLVDTLYICRRVAASIQYRTVLITLEGTHPEIVKFLRKFPNIAATAGSPLACLVATILAYAYGTSLRLIEEELRESSLTVILELQ